MSHIRKLMCIADGTPECRTAILFAAERAKHNGSGLVILRVIEALDNSLISAMGPEIMEDLRIEALEHLQSLAKEVSDITPELIIKEGDVQAEILEVISNDEDIKTLVLAASRSKSGPGPLVSSITRGSLMFGNKAFAIMIVPEGLSDKEIKELAS